MKATYRNSIRSRELIKEAMFQLLNKKEISQITVSDIVREANINRGTFYNHYNNPIEIIEEVKDELISSLSEGLRLSMKEKTVDAFMTTVLEHIQTNENIYRRIVNSIPMSLIDSTKEEFIAQLSSLNVEMDCTTIYFLINGISGIYLDYLKGNMEISADKIKETCKDFIEFAISKNAFIDKSNK